MPRGDDQRKPRHLLIEDRGDGAHVINAREVLGLIALARRHFANAPAAFTEIPDCGAATGDPRLGDWALAHLGQVALAEGDVARAKLTGISHCLS